MMAEPKTFASLSSGLLARKGAAKPAMRPQGFGQMGVSMEDLGWNDMGQSHQVVQDVEAMPEHMPSSIAALTPAPRLAGDPAPAARAAPPVVVEQQRAIETSFAPKATALVPRTAKKAALVAASLPQPQAAGAKSKAAFTLRLDRERHLKLRLACALTNRSAQQIVTESLDGFLASIPELDALVRQVPDAAAKKN